MKKKVSSFGNAASTEKKREMKTKQQQKKDKTNPSHTPSHPKIQNIQYMYVNDFGKWDQEKQAHIRLRKPGKMLHHRILS